jgi:hypothetical protein
MKFVALGLILAPLVCSASEPLIPMAEGTTWSYDLLQKRPSGSLDLTEPNEEAHIAVAYRVGGTEKIEGKELRRLEIYRGDILDSVDLISVDEHGIVCPARSDGKGGIITLNPPQQMLAAPLKIGTNWNFDGTTETRKCNSVTRSAAKKMSMFRQGNFTPGEFTATKLCRRPRRSIGGLFLAPVSSGLKRR